MFSYQNNTESRGLLDQAVATADAREEEALFHGEETFYDTFSAGVGFVFDEELSISSLLNNEGYADRNAKVKSLADSGFDVRAYQDRDGGIDYDRLANDTDVGIKTNLELYRERNGLLEQRRNYSEGVKERGNGMAGFLGSMSGYMLDPVNVATLPIGASVSALRGLGAMASAVKVAKTEAMIAIGAEALIQPFVYQHKNDINSPYSGMDAITAIGTAALGAAALGGFVGGLGGYLRKAAGIDVDGLEGAKEAVIRLATDVEANPERQLLSQTIGRSARKFYQMDNDELSQSIILLRREIAEVDGPPTPDQAIALEAAEAVFESRKGRFEVDIEVERQAAIADEINTLKAEEDTRLPRGERKALNQRLQELRTLRNAVTEAEPEIKKAPGVPARKAKAAAEKIVKQEADAKRAEYQAEIDAIESRLEASRSGEEARSNLSRVQQGMFPKRLQEALNQIENRRLIEIDLSYLKRLEAMKEAYNNQPTRAIDEPNSRTDEPNATPEGKRTEFDTLEEQALARYAEMDGDGVAVVDGEVVNAREAIESMTDEIQALEEYKACMYG